MAQPRTWTELQHLREKHRHTRLSLAAAVGCHVSTISRIEAGLCRPRPNLLYALSTELRCDVDHLIATAPKTNRREPVAIAAAS